MRKRRPEKVPGVSRRSRQECDHSGWKDFLVKDHPMLSPQDTMTKVPAPVMISYQ